MIKKYLPFLLLYLVLHITFLVLQIVHENYYLMDSYEYLQEADNIVNEGIAYCGDLNAPEDLSLYTKRPPGYPVFLSIPKLVTQSMLPVIILQALISLLSAVLLIKIFHREKSLSSLLIIFILFLPAQFIYANLIMSEILFQLIIMAATWFIYSFITTNNNRYLWAYQALICIGIMVKPVLYVFVFANVIFVIYLYFKRKKRLLLLSGFIPVIFVIIISGLNQHKTGLFHVSSIQQVNIVDVNVYYFLMQQKGAEEAREITDEINSRCEGIISFKAYADCLNSEAKSILREDLPAYGIFHMKGVLRYFIDPGRFDLYNFFGLQSSDNDYRGIRYHLFNGGVKGAIEYLKEQPVVFLLWILAIAFFNVLKLIGFAFFIFNKKIALDFRIFLFLLIGTIAFSTGPLGASRFALPFALIILGGAAVQYQQWYSAILQKRKVKLTA